MAREKTKGRAFTAALLLLCALSAAAALLPVAERWQSAELAAFPFRQAGALLRALSLSGAAGNAAAWALYLLAGLLPALYLLLRVCRRRAAWPDALLAALSALLCFALYLFINPAALAAHFGGAAMAEVGGAALGGTLYSLLLAYLGLRACRALRGGLRPFPLLRALLLAAAAVLALSAGGGTAAALRASFAALREGNTALSGAALAPSYAFLVLQAIPSALASLAGIAVIRAALPLTRALEAGPYTAAAAECAQSLARVCCRALAAVLLAQAAVNAAQALLGGAVRASDYTVSLPLGQMALLLGALLLSQLIARSRALQEDSDSII